MKKFEYRSPNLPAGFFNRLGTLHMHVDGAQDQGLILRLVQVLEDQGNPGKLNHVERFIAGPQREILPEVYQSHTPELGGEEVLEFFSTNFLKNRANAVEVVNFICDRDILGNVPCIITEVEEPVMWLGPEGWKSLASPGYVSAIQASEVKLAPSPSLDFEIHHGFNLPKENTQVDLAELGYFCEKNSVVFGGWFVFEKPSCWTYRSNSFSNWDGLEEQVEREQSALNNFLAVRGFNGPARTLVEKVLGIWHSK